MDLDTGRVAIATGMPAPREWFIFDQARGGHYSSGVKEDVDTWHSMLVDDNE